MPTNFTSSINLHDLPDLEILRGRESELNWEPRERLISNLIAFFSEQRSQLDYSHAGMAAFSGSFADLRASAQALPANDPRFVISGWIKSYYEDIMAIVILVHNFCYHLNIFSYTPRVLS